MVLSVKRWAGKVAVVTGASSGIGAAIAKKLAENGLQVVGFARRVERVEELSKTLAGQPGKLFGLKVDLTKEKEVVDGFEWVSKNVGPISVLVNNAGILAKTTLVDGDAELWRKVLDTNVLGLCIATKEAIKNMKENNTNGHIININSIAGHRVYDFPNQNLYSASKFAVTSITETLRYELKNANSKIKISGISPGGTVSEILGDLEKDLPKDRPRLRAEDVADAVLYVLSTPPNVQVHELMIRPLGEAY